MVGNRYLCEEEKLIFPDTIMKTDRQKLPTALNVENHSASEHKNMIKLLVSLILWLIAQPLSAQLYAVGPFNNWDAKNPIPFEQKGDVYSIILNFTNDRDFKMSTVSGEGSSGNGWSEFDSGALKPIGATKMNEWVALKRDHNGNIVAPTNKELTVEVNLAKMEMRFLDAEPVTYSGTLPVLFINTEGNRPITSKETYLSATYWLDPCGDETVEAIGSAEAPLPLQIKGRGNWTWTGFNKKPYRLKLGEKAALAGMQKSKHFVLLAHADDNIGFMRNTLGFATSSILGMPWTPEQKAVEVVINGDYIGLYFLTENIRVDKNRVNVTEQADYSTTDVDGGWLVEIDNYDSDPHVTVYEGTYPIWFTYKSPELLSEEQSDFLTNEMQSIQDAIANKDYEAFSELVDVDVLARYYIVQEVMNDYESFHGSCYLWRQRGDAEKWKFGPVWDFGSALFTDNNDWIYNSGYHQVWIGAIVANFPEFNEKVKSVWAEFLKEGAPSKLLAEGKAFAEKISKAAICNYRRWPEYGNRDEMGSAEIAFRRINSKIDWLSSRWGGQSGLNEVTTVSPSPVKRMVRRDGILHIYSAEETEVMVVNLAGLTRKVQLMAGDNYLSDFPTSIYFIVPMR